MIRLHCSRASSGAMTLIKGLREEGINALRIKRRNSRYPYNNRNHWIINWGDTNVPSTPSRIFNSNEAVANASSKTQTLSLIANPVPFTTDRSEERRVGKECRSRGSLES